MKQIILGCILVLLLTGCGTFYSAVDAGGDNIYEDNILIIDKQLTPIDVKIKITNKSEMNLEILWDSCGYTDVSGKSYTIIHAGTKFLENGEMKLRQTIIPPKETISDFVTPVEALINKERMHEWKTEMYATHHKTVNQIYIVGEEINYRNKKELVDFIGKKYTLHLVFLHDSKELIYDLTGEITGIIDLLK